MCDATGASSWNLPIAAATAVVAQRGEQPVGGGQVAGGGGKNGKEMSVPAAVSPNEESEGVEMVFSPQGYRIKG